MLPSPDHRGATPPQFVQVKIDSPYVGAYTVGVKTGTFAARNFQFLDDGSSMARTHPPDDLWSGMAATG